MSDAYEIVTRMREAVEELYADKQRRVSWVGVSDDDFEALCRLAGKQLSEAGYDVEKLAVTWMNVLGVKVARLHELTTGTIRVCWVDAPPPMEHTTDALGYLFGGLQKSNPGILPKLEGKPEIFLGGKKVSGSMKINLKLPDHHFGETGEDPYCEKCGIERTWRSLPCEPGGPWKGITEKADPLL
jgi:hypothetical protein